MNSTYLRPFYFMFKSQKNVSTMNKSNCKNTSCGTQAVQSLTFDKKGAILHSIDTFLKSFVEKQCLTSKNK